MIHTKRAPLEKKFYGYINNPRVVSSCHKKGEVTSLYFAELTNKKHNHIMRDIRELKCSPEFKTKHFSESFYRSVRDRSYPCYNMTILGFTLLLYNYKINVTYRESILENLFNNQ